MCVGVLTRTGWRRCQPEWRSRNFARSCPSGCGRWKACLPRRNKTMAWHAPGTAVDRRCSFRRIERDRAEPEAPGVPILLLADRLVVTRAKTTNSSPNVDLSETGLFQQARPPFRNAPCGSIKPYRRAMWDGRETSGGEVLAGGPSQERFGVQKLPWFAHYLRSTRTAFLYPIGQRRKTLRKHCSAAALRPALSAIAAPLA